ARMADGLDVGVGPELLTQTPYADVDDVRARVEVVSPYIGKQTFAADHLADVEEQVMQQPELAVREIRDQVPDARRSAREIEEHATRLPPVLVLGRRDPPPQPPPA